MRLFEDHIENRLQFTRRRIDDAQHLGNGLLLFQALAQLGQEARILDRDHRLIGKAADKFDLPLGEWLNPLPPESNCADRDSLPEQGHAERGPGILKGNSLARGIF